MNSNPKLRKLKPPLKLPSPRRLLRQKLPLNQSQQLQLQKNSLHRLHPNQQTLLLKPILYQKSL
jgi:hypothetical protein